MLQIIEKSSNHPKLIVELLKIIINKKSQVQNKLLEYHLMINICHIKLTPIKLGI